MQMSSKGGNWQFFINTVGSALPGRPIQDITEEILKNLEGDIIPSTPLSPLAKKYTQFKQRMPKNAQRFNFANFETSKSKNSMYHDELLPYRTAIPKGTIHKLRGQKKT